MNSLTTHSTYSKEEKERRELWKATFCRGATDQELELFIAVCERTGLNPEARQIWAIRQWDKGVGREVIRAQTSVDGFRLIAERSTKYAGQLGPFWCDNEGMWVDVWLKSTPPVAAKVGVLRHDFKEPLWAVARFDSYAAKDKSGNLTSFWAKMPDSMLGKCAESLALRRGFPNDLSGLYTKAEMDQADVIDVSPETPAPTPVPPPSLPAPTQEAPKSLVIFQKSNRRLVEVATGVLAKELDEAQISRALEHLEGKEWKKAVVSDVIDAVKFETEVYLTFGK